MRVPLVLPHATTATPRDDDASRQSMCTLSFSVMLRQELPHAVTFPLGCVPQQRMHHFSMPALLHRRNPTPWQGGGTQNWSCVHHLHLCLGERPNSQPPPAVCPLACWMQQGAIQQDTAEPAEVCPPAQSSPLEQSDDDAPPEVLLQHPHRQGSPAMFTTIGPPWYHHPREAGDRKSRKSQAPHQTAMVCLIHKSQHKQGFSVKTEDAMQALLPLRAQPSQQGHKPSVSHLSPHTGRAAGMRAKPMVRHNRRDIKQCFPRLSSQELGMHNSQQPSCCGVTNPVVP